MFEINNVERLSARAGEDISSIVQRFAVEGRAMTTAVQENVLALSGMAEWYQDFSAGVGHRLGAIMHMYARTMPGIKRTLVLGANVLGDPEKLYRPQWWEADGLHYTFSEKRHGKRRGPLTGSLLEFSYPLETYTRGTVDFNDNTSSLGMHTLTPRLAASVILENGQARVVPDEPFDDPFYRERITNALDQTFTAIESMPGITTPEQSGSNAAIIDVDHSLVPGD